MNSRHLIQPLGHAGRMDIVFKLLGVALGCYVARALARGSVYAKSGVWGRTFTRSDNAFGYWSAIGAYTLLAIALALVF